MPGRIVVCGGGLMGLSVAYNMAKRGVKDLFLFKRNCIGAHNATRVSTGMLTSPMFYSDPSLRSVVRKSYGMYTELAKDGAFKFPRHGRVYLASSDETALQARRLYSRISTDSASSSEAELLDCPSEMVSRWPMLNTEDVKLAVFSPLDATVEVLGLCRLLTDHCRELGVQVYENCGIKKVLLNEENRVYAVDTDEGFIDANTFVNAAGIWASLVEVLDLPEHQKVRIAAHPCAYTFLSTEPLAQANPTQPVFIGMDEHCYIVPGEHRTICGGFVEGDLQSLTMPTQTKGKQPEWNMPPPNWDKFGDSMLPTIQHGDCIYFIQCKRLKMLRESDVVCLIDPMNHRNCVTKRISRIIVPSISASGVEERRRTHMVEDIKREMENMGIEVGDPHMEPQRDPGNTGEKIKVHSNVYGVKMESNNARESGGPILIEVLGDNRENSIDSREYGPVPLALVRYRAVYRVFPLNRRGWIT